MKMTELEIIHLKMEIMRLIIDCNDESKLLKAKEILQKSTSEK